MGTKIFIYVWINKHSNQLKNYYSNILIKPIFVPVNILKMNFALSIQPFFASRSNNLTVIFFHSVWIKNSSKIHCPFLNVYSFDLKNPYLFIYLFIYLLIYLSIYLSFSFEPVSELFCCKFFKIFVILSNIYFIIVLF